MISSPRRRGNRDQSKRRGTSVAGWLLCSLQGNFQDTSNPRDDVGDGWRYSRNLSSPAKVISPLIIQEPSSISRYGEITRRPSRVSWKHSNLAAIDLSGFARPFVRIKWRDLIIQSPRGRRREKVRLAERKRERERGREEQEGGVEKNRERCSS